jgi:hypothetical protein
VSILDVRGKILIQCRQITTFTAEGAEVGSAVLC